MTIDGLFENPWLSIALDDYEAHMALPFVAQADMLATVLAEKVEMYRPEALAIVGCAGGNGLDRVPTEITQRIVGVDLNPAYVKRAAQRYGHRFESAEFVCADIERDAIDVAPVHLVYAALLFEYVSLTRSWQRLLPLVRPGGVVVTVLQLPSASLHPITLSPYSSLQSLAPLMRLVPRREVQRLAERYGFEQISTYEITSAGGKRFVVDDYLSPLDLGR